MIIAVKADFHPLIFCTGDTPLRSLTQNHLDLQPFYIKVTIIFLTWLAVLKTTQAATGFVLEYLSYQNIQYVGFK
jgi:hypothetical protein